MSSSSLILVVLLAAGGVMTLLVVGCFHLIYRYVKTSVACASRCYGLKFTDNYHFNDGRGGDGGYQPDHFNYNSTIDQKCQLETKIVDFRRTKVSRQKLQSALYPLKNSAQSQHDHIKPERLLDQRAEHGPITTCIELVLKNLSNEDGASSTAEGLNCNSKHHFTTVLVQEQRHFNTSLQEVNARTTTDSDAAPIDRRQSIVYAEGHTGGSTNDAPPKYPPPELVSVSTTRRNSPRLTGRSYAVVCVLLWTLPVEIFLLAVFKRTDTDFLSISIFQQEESRLGLTTAIWL
ncbi:hypothetical protein BGZ83_003664 [Gryganskiella cystojenkinii]|nr:hypothetical protein BGZ83_003664 [Gryganskiella cystojenkinii]